MEDQQNTAEELKKEIDQIRADYEKARGLLKNIQEFSDSLDRLKLLIESGKNEAIANSEQIKNWKSETEGLKNQVQGFVGDISVNLEKVKGDIVNMQGAYNQFSELKGKVTGRGDEIEGIVNAVRGLSKDIENIKLEAQKTLESIKAAFADVQRKTQELQVAYEGFLQIKGKIDDPDSGLKAIFDLVQGLKIKSETLYKEIQAYKEESVKLLAGIRKDSEESEALKAKIVENFSFTEKKRGEVEDITGLIIDTSFAETFERRKKEIEEGLYSRYSWKYIFFFSVFLLGIVVILPFTKWINFGSISGVELFLSRIYYTSPLLFLIVFSSFQYSKERDLVEKYAFKAASSAAIRNHIEFLLKNFNVVDDQKTVLRFAKTTFAMIYNEPHGTSDDSRKKIKALEEEIKYLQGERLNKKGISIKEITESVKELKKILPEESLFEKVIDAFKNR